MAGCFTRFLGVSLLSFTLLAQGVVSDRDRDFIETHFGAAKRAESTDDLPGAINEYATILRRYPSAVPGVYQNLGLLYFARRQYADAIRTFEAGLKLDPEMLGAHLFLGASYLYTDQARKGLPHLIFAHAHHPTAESATFLGQAYRADEQFEKAAQCFRQALALSTGSRDEILYLIGDHYLSQAERIVNTQTQLDPDSKYSHLAAAKIFESQSAYQIAAIQYLETARLDPMNASIFLPLARLLTILNLEDAADLALERYRRLMPGDSTASIDSDTLPKQRVTEVGTKADFEGILRKLPPVPDVLPPLPMLGDEINEAVRRKLAAGSDSHWRAATEHLVAGRFRAAIGDLEALRSKDDEWLRKYLEATVYLWLEDFDTADKIVGAPDLAADPRPLIQLLRAEIFHHLALNYFSQLLAEYPDSARAHFIRGRSLAEQKKFEAEEEFQAALSKNPNLIQVRISLIDFYLAESRYEDALVECRRTLEYDASSALAKLREGRIHVELRDPEKAIPLLIEGLESMPDDAAARADLARAYEGVGKMENAVEEYQRALKLDPSLNRVHYVLGRIFRQSGRSDLANREIEIFRANEAREQREQVERIQRLKKITPK